MKQLFIPGASRKNEEDSITIKCMHGLFLNSEQVSHRWNSWWSELGWACAGCWCDSPSTPAAESRSVCRRGVWVIRLQMSAATPPKIKQPEVGERTNVCPHDSCEEKPDLLSHQTKETPVISQSRLYLHSQGHVVYNKSTLWNLSARTLSYFRVNTIIINAALLTGFKLLLIHSVWVISDEFWASLWSTKLLHISQVRHFSIQVLAFTGSGWLSFVHDSTAFTHTSSKQWPV